MSFDPNINQAGLNNPFNLGLGPIVQAPVPQAAVAIPALNAAEVANRNLHRSEPPLGNPDNPPLVPNTVELTQEAFNELMKRLSTLESTTNALNILQTELVKQVSDIQDLNDENKRLKKQVLVTSGVAAVCLGIVVAPYAAPLVAPILAKVTAVKVITTSAVLL